MGSKAQGQTSSVSLNGIHELAPFHKKAMQFPTSEQWREGPGCVPAALKALRSIARRPAIVVPPGEVILSRRIAVCSLSVCVSIAVPRTDCRAACVANSRGKPLLSHRIAKDARCRLRDSGHLCLYPGAHFESLTIVALRAFAHHFTPPSISASINVRTNAGPAEPTSQRHKSLPEDGRRRRGTP